MKYYATINNDNICDGISQLSGEVIADNLIEIDSYDTTLFGKVWTGSEWIENPNPPDPPEPDEQPSNQDIMDMLVSMQGDQVPTATLDAAYREGVNAYAE